jgi:hypothetical protein
MLAASNQNLTLAQKELLLWHQQLSLSLVSPQYRIVPASGVTPALSPHPSGCTLQTNSPPKNRSIEQNVDILSQEDIVSGVTSMKGYLLLYFEESHFEGIGVHPFILMTTWEVEM